MPCPNSSDIRQKKYVCVILLGYIQDSLLKQFLIWGTS